jgi:peptidoglycan/LPS O-acetylase OafA/YrhL
MMDRKFIMAALGYAVIGMVLGIYMAASKNHGQFVTHAHIMLLGFVVSFIYGLCHKLWLNNTTSKLAVVQFYIHQAAALILVGGLFMLYGQFMEEDQIGPVLAVAAMTALLGMVLMSILFIKSKNA